MIYNHRDGTIDFIDEHGKCVYSIPLGYLQRKAALHNTTVWRFAMQMFKERNGLNG